MGPINASQSVGLMGKGMGGTGHGDRWNPAL